MSHHSWPKDFTQQKIRPGLQGARSRDMFAQRSHMPLITLKSLAILMPNLISDTADACTQQHQLTILVGVVQAIPLSAQA